jgi:hypothetical protein
VASALASLILANADSHASPRWQQQPPLGILIYRGYRTRAPNRAWTQIVHISMNCL